VLGNAQLFDNQLWLARMLNRKPPMPMIVALANKMARIAWALMTRGETYRARPVARNPSPA
jgi:transposase